MKLHLGNCLEVLPHYVDGIREGGKPFDMVFADLPYGVTANKWDTPIDLGRLWPLLLAVAKPNAAFVFTATQPFATTLINSQPKLFRYDLVWAKSYVSGQMNARKAPLRDHELILVFGGSVYNPQKFAGKVYNVTSTRHKSATYGTDNAISAKGKGGSERYPRSIVVVNESDLRRDTLNGNVPRLCHPTQKPVALLEWLIRTYSNPGDLILDPTMGSGTTGVACLNTGRCFVGIEKDPKYFRTAADRIVAAHREVA